MGVEDVVNVLRLQKFEFLIGVRLGADVDICVNLRKVFERGSGLAHDVVAARQSHKQREEFGDQHDFLVRWFQGRSDARRLWHAQRREGFALLGQQHRRNIVRDE